MSRILILGTGNAQVDAILECKKRGQEVYACSYRHGDKGEPLADKFILANIIDPEAVKQAVLENNIDSIYSVGSDVAMPTVTKVAEDLNMKSLITNQTAVLCNNKTALREYLGSDFKGNIPFEIVESPDHEINLTYPLMLKPVDSQGQRGVYRINSYEDFKKNIEKSLSYSKEKKAIVEEFVEGPEISVNTFSENGKIIYSIVSDREVWTELPGGIIHKHHIPVKSADNETVEKIHSLVSRTLNKLNIQNGPAYFQIKLKDGIEPVLIEVTPRLDGCHMWKLIREYYGINLLDLTLNMLEGKELHYPKPVLGRPDMTLEFICQPPETEFYSENHQINPNSHETVLYYNDGETVKHLNGYMEKCGYQIIDNSENPSAVINYADPAVAAGFNDVSSINIADEPQKEEA